MILSAVVEFFMIVEMGQGMALKIGSFLGAMMGFSIAGMLMIAIFWGVGEMTSRIVYSRRNVCAH